MGINSESLYTCKITWNKNYTFTRKNDIVIVIPIPETSQPTLNMLLYKFGQESSRQDIVIFNHNKSICTCYYVINRR